MPPPARLVVLPTFPHSFFSASIVLHTCFPTLKHCSVPHTSAMALSRCCLERVSRVLGGRAFVPHSTHGGTGYLQGLFLFYRESILTLFFRPFFFSPTFFFPSSFSSYLHWWFRGTHPPLCSFPLCFFLSLFVFGS